MIHATEKLCYERYLMALLHFEPVLCAFGITWLTALVCRVQNCGSTFCSTWFRFKVLFNVLKLFSLETSCAELELVVTYFVRILLVCVASFALLQTGVTVISVVCSRPIRCWYSAIWRILSIVSIQPKNRFLSVICEHCYTLNVFSFLLLSIVTFIHNVHELFITCCHDFENGNFWQGK